MCFHTCRKSIGWFLSLWLICFATSWANNHPSIQHIYAQAASVSLKDMPGRISTFSALFLNKPYLLGALGEGRHARYDQSPIYRFDAFDCETYVDTVLALAFSRNAREFNHYIRKIRYHHGHVDFIDRNHFTCLDWNKNNQAQQLTQDITRDIQDTHHRKVARWASAWIDKPSWYQHFHLSQIKLSNATLQQKKQRLNELKEKGQHLARTQSKIPYVPLSSLFLANGKPNDQILYQIPQGAIIEIVRPNWDLTSVIGTHLNVSHLGFAIWTHGTLYFRQASSSQHKVVDVPLVTYLKGAQDSPTIKGINVQVALDGLHAQTHEIH